MRGSIWSVVTVGVVVAALPLIFSEDLNGGADSLGSEFLDLISALTPLFGVLILVSVTGLFLVFFSGDEF
jgi:hypothetical protein